MIAGTLAPWMAAAIAFTTLLVLAATALARCLASLHRPTRWIWLGALAIGAIWPIVAYTAFEVDVAPATIVAMTTVVAPLPTFAPLPLTTAQRLAMMAEYYAAPCIVFAWTLLSTMLMLRIVFAVRALRRARRDATMVCIDGADVLVSEHVGPAVLGRTTASIVIPRWVLSLDDALVQLVLRHEREHCHAADPQALWAASLACALLPWNAPLWYAAKRLRLAIEIDCDARVLRGGDDADLYGRLLLLVAQQKRATAFAPMLAHTPSQLARRIAAMHPAPARHPQLQRLAAVSVAAIALLAACSQRIANGLAGPSTEMSSAKRMSTSNAESNASSGTPVSPTDTNSTTRNRLASIAPGEQGPTVPAELRTDGTSGVVVTQFVVDTSGRPIPATLKIIQSTHEAFTQAVRERLLTLKYLPAIVDGVVVRQLVSQPFAFFVYEGNRTEVVFGEPKLPVPLSTSRIAARAATDIPDKSPNEPGRTYFDYQVDTPVYMAPGSTGPKYPPALRAARREGQVLAQFIVDANGVVDMRTFKVLRTADPAFADAVKDALASMKFIPAQRQGQRVSQLVQQPFQFALP